MQRLRADGNDGRGWPLNLIVVPQILASCPHCGCLVFAQAFPEVTRWVTAVWDPGLGERRMVRAILGPGDLQRQGFASLEARPHECPDDSPMRVDAIKRRRRA